MRNAAASLLALTCIATLTGCGGDDTDNPVFRAPTPAPSPTPTSAAVTFDFDFGATGGEWTRDIAEFGDRSRVDFQSRVEDLPADLIGERGLLLAGTNVTDDLAMYAWREVENLEPGRAYRVDVTLTIASRVPPGCAGVGGSPGEGVYIKAGAADEQPRAGPVLNVNKANQSQSGTQAVVIGDLAVPSAGGCTDDIYAAETIATTEETAPVVRATNLGELFLIVLSDSGFESRSEWYLLEGSFTLTPQ